MIGIDYTSYYNGVITGSNKAIIKFMEEINKRPASKRAVEIAERNKHNFKIEVDEEASKFMFPQNERLK